MTDPLDGIPDKIRIGAHDIAVTKMPAEWGHDNDEIQFGEMDEAELMIRLRVKMPSPSFALDVVLHEIAHAILNPLRLRSTTEEKVVTAIGAGFAQVLRDNPELLNWINKKTGNNKNECQCGGNCACKSGSTAQA